MHRPERHTGGDLPGPQERFVANFIGLTNFVEGRVHSTAGGQTKSARSRPPAEGCAACYPTTSRREIVLYCSYGRKISTLASMHRSIGRMCCMDRSMR